MDTILDAIARIIGEAGTILVLTLIGFLGKKLHAVLEEAKKKNKFIAEISKLDIVNTITDQVVEFAEAELTGEAGSNKRQFALEKALEILEARGIHLSEAEILAGIENGVNKMKQKKQ